ncbi:MAG: DUF5711 family protein [Tissierellaceae bacterium]|nr:DUF5711 family protein [Tissierellaceae bacterium]
MKRDRKSKGKRLKILLFIALAVAIILIGKDNKLGAFSFVNQFLTTEKSMKIKYFIEDENILDVKVYDENIAKWKNNKLSFLRSNGNIIVEKEFNFSDPGIFYGNRYIYVFDRDTGNIYILDKKGETVNRLHLDKQIFNIKESGNNLLYHIKAEGSEIVGVLDKDGVLIGNYTYENENILTYASSTDGELNALGLLDISDGSIGSKIDIYGEVNKKIKSIFIEGELILHIGFTSNNELIALTDRNLYFTKDGSIMWKKQYDLIKDIYVGEERIYILYSNYLEIMDYGGRVESKISFGQDYNKISILKDRLVLNGSSQLVVMDKDKQILKHSEAIIKAFQGKNSIVLWTPEGIKVYDIVNKTE